MLLPGPKPWMGVFSGQALHEREASRSATNASRKVIQIDTRGGA